MSIKEKYFVEPIERADFSEWILKKHYAHRMPSVMFSYGIYDNSLSLCGVCLFGMPPCQMNDGKGIFKSIQVKTYELTRLVTNNIHERNMTSFFVSRCLRHLPSPSCIVSFADPNNNHYGYIYQATNWMYTGLTQKGGKDKQWVLHGREFHAKTITVKWMKESGMEYDDSKNMTHNWKANGGQIVENTLRKYRYIYLRGTYKQKKQLREALLLPIMKYPKGNSKKYDASWKPAKQNLLF